MSVSILTFITYITIKFVLCGQFYETDKRQDTSTKYTILSKENQPSQLSCLHVCRVKHRYTSTSVWFKKGHCKCLQENEVDGEYIIDGKNPILREIPKVLFFEYSVILHFIDDNNANLLEHV